MVSGPGLSPGLTWVVHPQYPGMAYQTLRNVNNRPYKGLCVCWEWGVGRVACSVGLIVNPQAGMSPNARKRGLHSSQALWASFTHKTITDVGRSLVENSLFTRNPC